MNAGAPPGRFFVIEGGAGTRKADDVTDRKAAHAVARCLAAEDGGRTGTIMASQVAATSVAAERQGGSGITETMAPLPPELPAPKGSPSSNPSGPSPDRAEHSHPGEIAMAPAMVEPPAHEAARPAPKRRGATQSKAQIPGGAARAATVASGAVVPTMKAPKPRNGPRKAERRAAPDPEVVELRKRPPAELWDMGVEEAFKYAEAKLSGSGTDQKWIRGSLRGFRATAKLASTFFGKDTKLRDISHGDCLNFVEGLALVPDTWGKSPKTRLPMSQLIQGANDLEDFRLCVVEHRAETEGWCDQRFEEACAEARVDRLAPRTQFKHQCYVGQVFKIVIEASECGKSPMTGAIWSRKERDKRIAEGWGRVGHPRIAGLHRQDPGRHGAYPSRRLTRR